ncbi:hypothetical protein [Gilvimarinus algae]|uniref:Lipoprotein n=1 Tax=Gilvimarinus algae TaxID=3058037 RepID=A0ABT8TIU5_9GAMM|nr:hypothetical protein [Gilvimarinus sp. SDUM040014]MDO3383970.1 hypothetical protein [Gilvimarinus sp. SDUM040014]
MTSILFACSSMPVGSMLKMRSVDPLTMDGRQLKIAVILPKRIDISQAHVVMLLGFDAVDDQLDIAENLEFSAVSEQRLPADFVYSLQPEENLVVMELTDEQARRLTQMQKRIADKKAEGVEGKGALGFSVSGFCLKDTPEGDSSLIANIYLQLDTTQEYMHLIRDLDLTEQDIEAEQALCKNWKGYQGTNQLACSPAWVKRVSAALPVTDGAGHGPDPGSVEWQGALEFALGLRDDPDVPPRQSQQWCEYIAGHLEARQ